MTSVKYARRSLLSCFSADCCHPFAILYFSINLRLCHIVGVFKKKVSTFRRRLAQSEI